MYLMARRGAWQKGVRARFSQWRRLGGLCHAMDSPAFLTGMPDPCIRWTDVYGTAMCSRSVLVHCPCRLGAAAAVLAVEFRCRDRVLTKWTSEPGHAVHRLDRVMSHSFKSSLLSPHDSEPKLLNLKICVQPVCLPSESAGPSQCLLCAGGVMAIACDFCFL